MKTVLDIIYKEPKRDKTPDKPSISALVIVSVMIYALSFIGRENGLSNIDFFLIPVFILAIGLQVYFLLKKKKE